MYRAPGGGESLMRDDAELAAKEAELTAELDNVRAQRRLNAGYMLELGIKPPSTPGAALSKADLFSSAGVIVCQDPIPLPITRAPKTWREFIAVVLRQAGRSMTNKEVIEAGTGTEFEDRFKAGPNGYYNTTRMMELNGELVKVGKRLYDPAFYAKIQSGEASEEDLPVEATRESIPNIILRALREHGVGLEAAGVIEALRAIPETSAIADRNPALIRTHLSKMLGKGQLARENSKYKLPEWSRSAEIVLPFTGGSRG